MPAMVVDVIRIRWFVMIAILSTFILLGALLLGFLGPATYDQKLKYAYNCENNSHIAPCSPLGVSLGNNGSLPYTYRLPELGTLNGFWSLTMFPYNKDYKDTGVIENLRINTTIRGSNKNKDINEWHVIVNHHISDEVLLCDEGTEACWGFVLSYEDTIKYNYYQVEISLPDDNNPGKQYIGDVGFQYSWYSESYVEEELSIRVIFLLLTTVSIFIFWARMRTVELQDWFIEQKFLAVLLLTLVALNNPFYPFEFLVSGWFFPTLDCFLQVIHSSIHMLFWLFMFDHIRSGNDKIKFAKVDIVKPAVVGVYAIFTLIFFVWFKVSHEIDPLFGETQTVSGLVIMFFFCSILFGGILVWVLVLMMLAIPVVWQKKYLTARFSVLAIPTVVVLFSIVGGLFFGSFGPIRRTAPSFVYFFTLYNLYVLVLLFSYWPIKRTGFTDNLSNPTEFTPIYGNEKPSEVFANEGSDNIYGNDDAL
eukprot:TRINITY_DN3054_c0_g4_i1.p1 TRINITY_DN3054_c0_g4~~TRINITY_DN3054_c0_g4_i1.p1  ORF type:complete len:477 (+),score=119.67 TRINITY_DN3054_c0_g4_i1:50-1480(+)